MPLVHPTHVVSFSSEDPNHPASNLLNRDTFRKWKCKDVGEKEAWVILKFDKAVSFSCIDVGNDGSALVEVSVARSGNGEPQYEVLLSSTAFMSPLDSREGKNLFGVRSFSANSSLSKPVAAQKWDLVKVLVSQPFNRHVQYGLTFIKFTAVPDPNEPQKIGMFGLRKPIGGGDSDEEDDVRPGSFFTRAVISPKASPSSTVKPSSSASTNAEIWEVSNELRNASKLATDDKVKEIIRKPKLDPPTSSVSPAASQLKSKSNGSSNVTVEKSPLLNRKKLPDPPLNSKDAAAFSAQNSSNYSPKPSSSKFGKKRTLSPEPQSSSGSPKPSSSQTGTLTKKQKKSRKTKPFNKLFEGVVFCISGYENPYRGEIRDKAVQMGARYKTDWDRTCTHLICAFVNTPKFRQVRSAGNGEIVKIEWIEKSFADRCRYPWRRFCLDRNDKGAESEEEIFAEDTENNDEEFMEEPMQIEMREDDNDDVKLSSKSKRKRVLVMESSDESEHSNDSKKAYEADTDVDEDRTPDLSPSILQSNDDFEEGSAIFENHDFYICVPSEPSPDSQHEIKKLEQIIKKRKGRVHRAPTHDIEYYICHSFDWEDDFTDALSDNPNLTFVHERWILECEKSDRLVNKKPFILLPS